MELENITLSEISQKWEGSSATSIKDTCTKPKGVGSRVGSGDGWGAGCGGGKMETTVLEQL